MENEIESLQKPQDREPDEKQIEFFSVIRSHISRYIATNHNSLTKHFFDTFENPGNYRRIWQDFRDQKHIPKYEHILFLLQMTNSHLEIEWSTGEIQQMGVDLFQRQPFKEKWEFELSKTSKEASTDLHVSDKTLLKYRPKVNSETSEVSQFYPDDFFIITRFLSCMNAKLRVQPGIELATAEEMIHQSDWNEFSTHS